MILQFLTLLTPNASEDDDDCCCCCWCCCCCCVGARLLFSFNVVFVFESNGVCFLTLYGDAIPFITPVAVGVFGVKDLRDWSWLRLRFLRKDAEDVFVFVFVFILGGGDVGERFADDDAAAAVVVVVVVVAVADGGFSKRDIKPREPKIPGELWIR